MNITPNNSHTEKKSSNPLAKKPVSEKEADKTSTTARRLFTDRASSSSSQTPPLNFKRTPIRRKETEKTPTVARKLFTGEVSSLSSQTSPINFERLSEYYQRDFLRLKTSENATDFFSIREQVLEIEKFLEEHEETVDPKPIRARIQTLLDKSNFEQKMAEMGMILFYLDHDQVIPDTTNLVLFRANEISENVEAYLQRHASICDNPLIPSGKTHYLLRTFAHMVLTSTQAYNRGGLMAIRVLLKYSEFTLSKYLQAEHRNHILLVTKKILKSSNFNMLFNKQIRVHPDLQNAIRLDLKLPPEEPISSVFAFYDCLMALFSDIRQDDSPNCYAISALIYATENHTYKVFSKSMDWLEQGFISMGESSTIPLAPLLEKRLIYSHDLNFELKPSDALSLAPIKQITQTLNLTTSSESPNQPVSIRCTLSAILKDNNAIDKLPYVEKLYYAYKYNTLIHLHHAVSELTMVNTETEEYFTDKDLFILTCLSQVRIDNPYFKSAFETKLKQRLWLENCNEKNV